MFHARFSPTAKLNARAPRRSTTLAALLSALVASTSFTVVLVHGPAEADQISSLRAQATALSQQLIREQLQVGAYEQQYSVATAKTAADVRAIARLDRQIAQDQRQISRRTGAVRQQAIASYMNYGTGPSGPDASLFSGNEETVQAASEYSGIAVGNITTAVDQLRTAQRTLQAGEGDLQRQEAADRAEQGPRGRLPVPGRRHSGPAAGVTGPGDRSAGRSRGPAGRRPGGGGDGRHRRRPAGRRPKRGPKRSPELGLDPSATAAATAQAAPVASTSGPTTPDPGGGATTDPALNPFLQCVVQAESGGNYGAVSPNGLYMGAFQFSQPTWNVAAQAAGLPGLIGMPPNLATKADQDTLAVALYALDGSQPWLGDRCSS